MIKAIPASDGIAIGKVFVLENEKFNIDTKTIPEANIDNEIEIVKKAIENSKTQIEDIKQNSEIANEILEAQILMLDDVELLQMISDKIKIEQKNASLAVSESIDTFALIMESLEDEYLRERSKDIRDIGNRILMNIQNKESNFDFDNEYIIVAKDISPSFTAQMNKEKILGFLTETGGITSHTVIISRKLEIPAIVGVENITELVSNGDFICFDGKTGEIIINPDEATISTFKNKKEHFINEKNELQKYIDAPSLSKDYHKIEIACNISSPDDIDEIAISSDGVGLFRTEFLYMNRENLPSEEEQFVAYKKVLQSMNNKPVIIRTFDIGGDKNIDYLNIEKEDNPFLGYRAIRISLDRKEIFKTQLRALVRASIYGTLKIMYPMISTIDEVREANNILYQCIEELNSENIQYGNFQVGIMIETPSAAILANELAGEVQFFSIGTNDLTQYTCAVDRLNNKVSHLYDTLNPSVLRLIDSVLKSAKSNNIFCGICGESAADEKLIPIYLGMGVNELSMNSSSILKAKKQISNLSYSECKKLSEEILKFSSASEIKEYLEKMEKQNEKI